MGGNSQMIVYKNKWFIINMEHPDTDWLGDADWVIPDDSELGKKIVSYAPNFDLIIKDGKLIDVKKGKITKEELDGIKEDKIAQSKKMLSEWLASHPYLYSDGKYYSCTEEKQSLLNSNLASYERATNAGIEYPLKWNSTGDECTEWTYQALLMLSLSIAAYVAPKVSAQQSFELQIKACSTTAEIDAIEISYD
jgi:hypothetical protein